ARVTASRPSLLALRDALPISERDPGAMTTSVTADRTRPRAICCATALEFDITCYSTTNPSAVHLRPLTSAHSFDWCGSPRRRRTRTRQRHSHAAMCRIRYTGGARNRRKGLILIAVAALRPLIAPLNADSRGTSGNA